ncbi:hypothetical protein CKM354_000937800 [Cercospora kikuchii]|uniref:Uncharacterized protein n=1 Tax=Cercospora kikuchii TaxID=84275 RepID=A0A9P3FKA4_9PEZI|nr:uncharacterized protein CKM354_000937800 [Cercospora kikuchii]GIZ46245.1 hypothetical protein CKM354_000937800 [Cercospora kikuchii]
MVVDIIGRRVVEDGKVGGVVEGVKAGVWPEVIVMNMTVSVGTEDDDEEVVKLGVADGGLGGVGGGDAELKGGDGLAPIEGEGEEGCGGVVGFDVEVVGGPGPTTTGSEITDVNDSACVVVVLTAGASGFPQQSPLVEGNGFGSAAPLAEFPVGLGLSPLPPGTVTVFSTVCVLTLASLGASGPP